jgi:hypothetical protein
VARATPKRVPARLPGSLTRERTPPLRSTMRPSNGQRTAAVITEPVSPTVIRSSIAAIDAKPRRRDALGRPLAELSRRQAVTIAVSLLVVAAAAVLAGRAGTGFDATWALVWARDLLHGHAASIPAHAFSVTPHPAAIGLGMLAGIVGFGHVALTVWSVLIELLVIATFVGVIRLGAVCGSYPAGWIACLAIAVEPGVRDGIGRGTTDIMCAAACVWALAVVLRHPKLAVGLVAVAALCRPEAWLVIFAICVLRWPQLTKPARLTAIVSAALVPIVWIVMGATMFGDALAAVHVTVANDKASTVGTTTLTDTMWHLPGWFGLLTIIGLVAAAVRMRKKPQVVTTLAATAVLTAGLLVENSGGASFVARYSTPVVALAIPLALAAIFTLPLPTRLRLVAPVGVAVLAAVALVSTRTARLSDNNKFAAQHRAVNSLLDVVDKPAATACTGVTVPQTALIPVIALAFRHGTAIDVADNPADVQSCILLAQSIDAMNADGWGPATIGQSPNTYVSGARVIARDNQWALYEH